MYNVYNYYDYYLRTDTKEEMESRLVGAGLGHYVQVQGVTCFVENTGVAVDHMGPYISIEPPPEPEILKNSGSIFDAIGAVKDSRWHTNLRTTTELYEAQKQYLPLIPPPSHPVRRFA